MINRKRIMNMPEPSTPTALGILRAIRNSHLGRASALLAALLCHFWTALPAHGGTGYALSFNGTNAYVDMNAAVIPASGDFTVMLWFNCPSAPASYREMLSQGSAGNAFYLGVNPAGIIRAGDTWADTGVSLPVGGWHHLAVVKSSTNTVLYLDGTNGAARGSAIANPAGATGFRLGRQYADNAEYWPGALDEVAVWSRALSAAEIQANRLQTPNLADANLAGYWPLAEGGRVGAPGGITRDASGHGHNGTLVNRPAWVLSLLPNQAQFALVGANLLTNQCHSAFIDPGVTALGVPAAIAGGDFYSLALKADGTVVSWGVVGWVIGGDYSVPSSATNAVAIAPGTWHCLALKADGTVVGWGDNSSGQTNVPSSATNVVAIAAGWRDSLALKADGTVVGWGINSAGQTTVPSTATNVVAIAAGDYHSLALKADGTVVGWGQTTVPPSATNVVAIAAGWSHSLALKADGTVIGWGDNSYGQTTVPSSATNVVAIAGGGNCSLVLKADGTVIGWGDHTYGQTNVPSSATNIVAIAGCGMHILALKADGTVIAWGDNTHGETSVPASVNSYSLPISVSGSVDTNTPGLYSLTYTAVGAAFVTNRTVVVADTLPPVLTLLGDNPLVVTGAWSDPGATAYDACAGDLTSNIVVTSSTTTNGYLLTYTVTDPSGNTSITNRSVVGAQMPFLAGLSASVVATNGITGARRAVLSASVNPNGLATAVVFQYGLGTNYPGSANFSLPAILVFTNVTVSVDGLMQGTTYHWCVLATNVLGATASGDQTLRLPALYLAGDVNGDGVVDQSELNAVLSNYWPASPWLQLTNPAGLGSSNVTFALTNSTAGAFSVESSLDLTNWQYLGPATPRYGFTDTNTPAGPQRFYRLRWP